jgi:type IV secretion system protein TrbL
MRFRRLYPFALLFALFLVPRSSEAQVLDQVVQAYQAASQTWFSRMYVIAVSLFIGLAVVEMAVSGILWAASSRPFVKQFLVKILLITFAFSLLTLFPLWVPKIPQSFQEAGLRASGGAAITPSAVVDLSGYGLLTHPTGAFFTSLLALLTLLCYVGLAVQLCLVLVESYLVLANGALFLGFAASRFTAKLAENYIAYSFTVGIRTLIVYLLIGIGLPLTASWLDLTHRASWGDALTPYLTVFSGSCLFAALVWILPNRIAQHLTAGLDFGLTQGLRSN